MKILFLFWSLWFLNFSTRTVLSPLLPVFEKDLSISHALAGTTFLFLALGYTSSLLAAGWLTPRVGFKRSIALGFGILTGTLPCLPFISSYWHLGFVALFLGLGGGIYIPCALPLLTSTISPEKWGKSIAFHETAASFSILAIPLLAAAAMQIVGWPALILTLSALCLVATTVFVFRAPDPRPEREQHSPFSRVLRRRDFWVISALWGFAAAGSVGLYNLIPLFLVNEKGLSIEMADTIFGFSRIGGLLVMFLAGFLIDKIGVKRVLLLSLLASGFGTTGIALADAFPLLVAMLVLQATFMPIFFTAGLVAITKLTDFTDRSAFAGATVAVGVIFGTGLAPTLLGLVADARNFETGIFIQGMLTMAVSLLLPLLRKIQQ